MRFKKSMLAGVVALATIAGAGAASAAPYTVASGDTMYLISKKAGVSLTSLIQANPQIYNPNIIWPGLTLNLPGNSGFGTVTTPSTGSGAVPTPATGTTPSTGSGTVTTPSADTTSASAFASQVVTLVNQERAKAGLQPLTSDSALTKMALDKAKDMYANNYFDHTSPTYGSPFDMMRSYGISYTYAGENIAKGQRTPQEVMTAWMNSAGHRQNILSANFTKIGVAYYNGEWVQEFIAN